MGDFGEESVQGLLRAKCPSNATERELGIVRQKIQSNAHQHKVERLRTYINRSFASVTYKSELAPFQGASPQFCAAGKASLDSVNEYRLEAYASAPLRYTSPQVKVLHCLTVKGQEARRKGVAARRGLRHRSAR